MKKTIALLLPQSLVLITGTFLGVFITLLTRTEHSIQLWTMFGAVLTGCSTLGVLCVIVSKLDYWTSSRQQNTYDTITTELLKSLLTESHKVAFEIQQSIGLAADDAGLELFQEARTRLVSSLQIIAYTTSTLDAIGININGKRPETDIISRCNKIESAISHRYFNHEKACTRHQYRREALVEGQRLKSLVHLKVKNVLKPPQ